MNNSLLNNRSCLFYGIIFGLLFLTFSNNSLGQDSIPKANYYELKNVVVTANKFEISLSDAPTKVEVISEEKILKTNGNRLPQLLMTASSVYLKSYGFTPLLQTISINGLGAEHTMIVMDGVKLNSFQNSTVDLSLIPKENIQRIEIINNGASSIYGSEAVGGVINIITNNSPVWNSGKFLQLSASLSSGSYATKRYSIGVYKSLDNFNAKIYYTNEKSDGNYSYYYNNGISTVKKQRENSSYSISDFGLNSNFFFDKNNRINLISTYSLQDKQIPSIETGLPPPPTKQLDKNWNNILTVENILSDSVTFRTVFNYQNNYMNYSVPPVLNSYYKNLVYAANTELNWKLDKINLTTGYNYTHAVLNSNEVDDGASRNQHALFISSEIIAAPGLRFFPSARYDNISDINQNVITYRFGLNYQPFKDYKLSFKSNVGKNFRAPTFNDLYWKESGNKNLKPENSFNAEAGILYFFDFLINGQIDITYIYINAKDKIVWLPQRNLIWAPQNIASSISESFSISGSFEKRFSKKISARVDAGITFTSSKKTSERYPGDPSFGKFLPYLPLQIIKLGLLFEYDFIGINLFYSNTGKRYSDFENSNEMESFHLLNGNLLFNVKIWEVRSAIKFEVNNIFNSDYQIISGYPMPLRNFLFTLYINY